MLFYKTEFVEIYYYPELKMVETCWLGFASSNGYRDGLEHYLEAARKYEVKFWMGDYRLARVVRMDDQEWAANEWFPRFMPVATGIEKMARVQSEDVFSQMSSDSMKEKLDISGLPFLFSEFKNYEDAKAWLLQEDQNSTEQNEMYG
ncbi:hypothetical protein [Pontibacter pudoricolor]|uniref:hypothetical protein n=1 Tax=Pontibacter pudoricolor TaxID=2694930 RepID=UPI001390CD5B|nr:hypothetical protein [Pontibacter pudoricolor]